jgi:hypothetical protein
VTPFMVAGSGGGRQGDMMTEGLELVDEPAVI